MSTQESSDFVSTDLPLTLYLNQRQVFDLLAVLRGGFSRFSTVHTTSSGETTTSINGKAQLGVSNVFALLGVNLDAHGSRQAENTRSENTTEEVIHTPASLFAQLRKELRVRALVRDVSSSPDLHSIRPSEFVEFEATLRRSPLIELLDTFSALVPLISLADAGTSQISTQNEGSRNTRKRKGADKRNEYSGLKDQIDLVKSAVTAEGSQDFIAEMDRMRVVLTTEQDYFIDPTMNDIIDGTFRVFGKATRVIADDREKISLLRKTAVGKFGPIVDALRPAIEEMQNTGFSGSVETDISGPTMQVIPIAIFS